MGSIDDLVRDLRGFEGRREVVKALRKRMREPVPEVRRQIKARALATLPSSGGLNVWVSKTRVTAQVKVSNRSVNVKLRGGRNSSTGKRSDMRRIDRGRLRHPSWGRRGPGQWHTQTVTDGFFTIPAANAQGWRWACERAVDEALEVIRSG